MISEIMNSKQKPKEKVAQITDLVFQNRVTFNHLMEVLRTGSDVEKGTCAEVMKHVTKDKPELALDYIKELIGFINHKLPRVKWGVPESIGHIARKYPKQVEAAVPKLLKNTKEKSTVIRWCAGFALTEIALHHPELSKALVKKLSAIMNSEKNNGVKNLYVKVLSKLK